MTTASQTLSDVFAAPLRDHAAQRAATQAAFEALPKAFSNRNRLHQYFLYTFVPRNLSWAFKPNGKTGTSSTLAFLFHLEFGLPVSTGYDNAFNPDQIVHRLAEARLFARLPEHPDVTDALAALAGCARLTTVRHPATRALSGYFYLCRAHELRADAFVAERLRMTALAGFDWARHAGCVDGFLLYLDWLAAEQALGGWMADSHFRPQIVNVRPDILRPDIVGRTEDMDSFFRAIAERLDRPMPDGALGARPRNAQKIAQRAAFLNAGQTRITQIFAQDFDAFGYDPQNPECRA